MRRSMLFALLLSGCLRSFATTSGGGSKATPAPGEPTPQTTTPLRRLSRTEYNNTVRDLLGDTTQPASALAADQPAFIFDNDAALMQVLDAQMQVYEQIAEQLIDTALADGSAARSQILSCDPASGATCVQQILTTFAQRAWRGPPDAQDLADVTSVYTNAVAQGDDAVTGTSWALKAILLHPRFLFRVETETTGAVSAWELATRLSYFVWSSMPDDELFSHASDGSLLTPKVYASEVARMLKDPKASALVDNFAAQWLDLNHLDDHAYVAPDPTMFPMFDDGMRASMKGESKAFVSDLVSSGASGFDLIDADYTFVDATMASLYGISGVTGTDFQKVSLDGTRRAGILGHGSILTITSHSNTTSPTRRGKWVMTRLLCKPPSPPPPNTPTVAMDPSDPTASNKVKMEGHAAPGTVCAGCHAAMDPIGFSLEHFDPIGRWQDQDNFGNVIDATGSLPDGTQLDGAASLEKVLRTDPTYSAEVRRCFAQNFFTFAMGREPTTTDDQAYLDYLAAASLAGGDGFDELVTLVATTQAFQNRGGAK